jgi:long-chain acyl-CoA synthetase
MGLTIVDIVRRWAKETPDEPMLSCGGVTTTWGEHDRRSSRVANALAYEGVTTHDRVAFIDKNGPAYFEVLFGGAKINAVNVAVNWRLAPPEMAYIINDAEAKVLFVGGEFLEHLAKFEGDLQTVTRIVVLDGEHAVHEGYDAWLGRHGDVDPGAVPAPGNVAMQLYTSGTTGLPKGVMLTNENFALMPLLSTDVGFERTSVSMVAMPLFHIGGSGWAVVGLFNGCHSVIIRDVDPNVILDSIQTYRITHTFVVPAVIMLLLMTPKCAETDFSSLELITYGASPITEKVLVQALQTFGCGFGQLYGLTETTGAITMLRPEDHDPEGPHADRLRSCGRPFDHVELRIVDPESGGDKPVGEVGEVWTRSVQNMKGYWHKEADTSATITADGWLRTGDAGFLDGDGFVYLHDRVKDMILSGGENIYPAEVENVLMAHPSVADVAVIGVPDDKWGETVKAIVVKAPGASLEPSELIEFARERLAHYKCPTSVDFMDVLPRNPSGKLLKRELREPFWKGVERRIH